MPLEGLRAWIGEVERKLAKRTRVFLVLTVIALGIAGAATYLAIDARESSVSESDVQTLQRQLEARIDELAATASPPPTGLEAQPNSKTEPETGAVPVPEAKPEAKPKPGRKHGGGSSSGAEEGVPSSPTGGAASAAKLQELLERAKERSEEAE